MKLFLTNRLQLMNYILMAIRYIANIAVVGMVVELDCIFSESLVDDVKCVWIKVSRHHRTPLVVGSMYRPPSASETDYEQMVDVLRHFTNCTSCVTVMGDFNYNYAPDVNGCRRISHIKQLTGLI